MMHDQTKIKLNKKFLPPCIPHLPKSR